ELLKHIHVPATVAQAIVRSLNADLGQSEVRRKEQAAALQQRLGMVRTRMDQMYEDKLEGKISEEFWQRKQSEYREQERLLEAQLSSTQNAISQDNILNVERDFELTNKAHS